MFAQEIIELTKARREDLQRELAYLQLLQEAKASQTSLYDRLLLSFGDGLIALGQRLKERYKPSDTSKEGRSSSYLLVRASK